MAISQKLTSFPVWDRTIRWFHWINVLCVIGLAAIGIAILYNKELGVSAEGKVLLKTIHVWIGYVFAINLGWRLIWAFFAKGFAGWRALVPGGTGYVEATRSYLTGLAKGNAPQYLGHNPLGRLAVTVLLALLLVQAVTGLVLAGTDIYFAPFGGWIAAWVAAPGVDPASLVPGDMTGVDETAYKSMRAFRKPFITVHYWNFFALCATIVVHVAAVVLTEIHEGGGIISAMFTGRKTFDQEPVDLDKF